MNLIKGIKNGIIDIIVSDHKPEDEESKDLLFKNVQLEPLELKLFYL